MKPGGDDHPDEAAASSRFFREIQIELLVHDLDDPFTVIEAGMQSLLEKQDKFGSLTDPQERVLRRSLRAALRGRSMLSILLEVGRSEFGRLLLQPFHPINVLQAVVLESVELIGLDFSYGSRDPDSESIDVVAALAEEGITINAPDELATLEIVQDAYFFGEIAANLIKNALRYRNQRLDIACYRAGATLVVEVADDGPGVPADKHDVIFELFAQAETAATRRGRGLGLAAARVLARRLGGDITLRSETRNGATFVFTVPLRAPVET